MCGRSALCRAAAPRRIQSRDRASRISVREVVERRRAGDRAPGAATRSVRGVRAIPAVLYAVERKIRRELGWEPQFEDLEVIVDTAWQWRRRIRTAIGAIRSVDRVSVQQHPLSTPLSLLAALPGPVRGGPRRDAGVWGSLGLRRLSH